MYLTRLLVAGMHFVGVVARQDKVLDLQFLMVKHCLEVLYLLGILDLINSHLLIQLSYMVFFQLDLLLKFCDKSAFLLK